MKKMNVNKLCGIISIPVMLGLSSCFLTEKPKTFSEKGITITLDNTFFKADLEGAKVAFSSSKSINIVFYDLDQKVSLANLFSAFDTKYVLSPIYEGQHYDELHNKGDLTYYEFMLDHNKKDMYVLLTAFSDTICEVNMPMENHEKYYETKVFEWLSTVQVEENVKK